MSKTEERKRAFEILSTYKLGHLAEEIEATLEQEKEKLLTHGLPSSTINLNPEEYANMQGWIEALEYVLKQIEVLH